MNIFIRLSDYTHVYLHANNNISKTVQMKKKPFANVYNYNIVDIMGVLFFVRG